jgi:hypothetical protein
MGAKSLISLLWGPKWRLPRLLIDPFRTVSLGSSVNRGNPPTFLLGKESSSHLSLLLLLWALFLWEQDVVDRDVHLRNPKAG